MKIIFLNSHPIAYKSDMYRHLTKSLPIEVWYCTKYGLKPHFDKEFNSFRSVDGLVEGFNHKFLFNLNFNSSGKEKIFDSLNPFIFLNLFKLKKGDLIICHGWSRLTMLLVMIFGSLLGKKVGLRCETPLIHEYNYSGSKKKIRSFILKNLFKRIDYFFYIGTYNKEFYISMGVPERKLIFMPYSCKPKNIDFKERELTNNIVFCGKLIEKKRPLDLLIAFSKLNNTNAKLIYAGDGSQKEKLVKKAKELQIENRVKFLGLLSPNQLDNFYSNADLLVLPSGYGETWGLVINEALEYSTPIIVSNEVGSSIDLCNENGYIFEYGNIDDLALKMNKFYNLNYNNLNAFRRKSNELKEKFSFKTITKNLLNLSN